MHGHLDNLLKHVPYVFNHCKDITGMGISPEASGNNPVLYDFFFETIWAIISHIFLSDGYCFQTIC